MQNINPLMMMPPMNPYNPINPIQMQQFIQMNQMNQLRNQMKIPQNHIPIFPMNPMNPMQGNKVNQIPSMNMMGRPGPQMIPMTPNQMVIQTLIQQDIMRQNELQQLNNNYEYQLRRHLYNEKFKVVDDKKGKK